MTQIDDFLAFAGEHYRIHARSNTAVRAQKPASFDRAAGRLIGWARAFLGGEMYQERLLKAYVAFTVHVNKA
jgi:hypothetical protein